MHCREKPYHVIPFISLGIDDQSTYMVVAATPTEMMQAKIVHMILTKRTEHALQVLSRFYRVEPPEIAVGTVKGKRKTAYAVYVPKERMIYAMNSDVFYNPFIILHEFYHHLRTQGGPHRGTEKHANLYARAFIDSYKSVNEKARAGKAIT